MLTKIEFAELEEYASKKPSLMAKAFLKYLLNNYVDKEDQKEQNTNSAAEALKNTRRSESYVWNPNPPGYNQTKDGKRGVHVRTSVDSEIADESRKRSK